MATIWAYACTAVANLPVCTGTLALQSKAHLLEHDEANAEAEVLKITSNIQHHSKITVKM